MKFAALSNYIPTPTITSPSKFFASQDNEFQLICNVEITTHVIYHVAFSHNGKVLETNEFVTISSLQHHEEDREKASINLTVLQGDEDRDKGEYKCTVMDFYNNTNSAFAMITFVSEPTVKMTPAKSVIEVDKGRKQAAFLVDFIAYPQASFKVYNPNGEPISNDHDVMDRLKYGVVLTEDTIKLVVKYPDISDFGEYTIVATTAGLNFSTVLRLIVSGELTNARKIPRKFNSSLRRETRC